MLCLRAAVRGQCSRAAARSSLLGRAGLVGCATRTLHTHADPAPQAVKPYETIVREMEARAAQWNGDKSKVRPRSLRRPHSCDELYKPLDVGDLVLLNLDPVMVIRTPDLPDGPYIVADAVGRAKEVFSNMIDARLTSLVHPGELQDPGTSLFMLDSAATDPGLEANIEPSVSSRAPTSRVVSHTVHHIIALPLRQLYTNANLRAKTLLPLVTAALARRQGQRAATCSFIDFLLEVCPNADSLYSVVDLYAVRLCLDHYTLAHKVLLDFSYTGKYALTVLSHSTEARNIEVVYRERPAHSHDFIVDYACGNLLGGTESEARAIELLRRKFPKADRIDSAAAAELLHIPLGGVSQRLRYDWFRHYDELVPQRTPDQMAQMREEFHDPVYCIDSADVSEIDDGISLRRLDKNVVRLGIHVANPSAFTENQRLVHDALPRPTSVYEIQGKSIPMLPRSLTQSLDLVRDKARPALTLFVDVNLNSMKFTNVNIKPLLLDHIVNYTPEMVDAARHEFAEFNQVAQALRTQRFKNGAFGLDFRADETFASVIVSEFMVLANHLAAEYCKAHNIPLLYRGQRVATQSPELRKLYNLARKENSGHLGFKWRPAIQKSLVSVAPHPHTGIGYRATTRFTSPLRRLEDYITHSQLEAHLRGDTLPFTENDLARMVPWLQVSQELVKEYQTQLHLYDTLTTMQPGEALEGIVSRVPWDVSTGSAKPRVFLPKYQIEADYVGTADLVVDEPIQVVVDTISASAGSVTVLSPARAQDN